MCFRKVTLGLHVTFGWQSERGGRAQAGGAYRQTNVGPKTGTRNGSASPPEITSSDSPSYRHLPLLLHLLARLFPTADAGGEVLHVGVAEGDGFFGGGLIGHALGAAAVGDDEGVLVLGELGGQLVASGGEVDRARDVAL